MADATGADPAVLIDEGDDDHVVGAAASRQLPIHALVVDPEGLDIEGDLDPGLVLEFGKISAQILVERQREGRAAEGRPGIFGLRLPEHRRIAVDIAPDEIRGPAGAADGGGAASDAVTILVPS